MPPLGATSVDLTATASVSVIARLPQVYAPTAYATSRDIGGVSAVWSFSELFNSNNSPEPTQVITLDETLGGSDFELDLSAAPIVGAVDGSGDPAATEDLDGLRLMAWHFTTRRVDGVSNAAAIVMKPKADATGYQLLGTGIADGVNLGVDMDDTEICKSSGKQLVDNAGRRVVSFSGTSGDKFRGILVFQG